MSSYNPIIRNCGGTYCDGYEGCPQCWGVIREERDYEERIEDEIMQRRKLIELENSINSDIEKIKLMRLIQ